MSRFQKIIGNRGIGMLAVTIGIVAFVGIYNAMHIDPQLDMIKVPTDAPPPVEDSVIEPEIYTSSLDLTVQVTATCYNPSVSQTDSSPYKTAFGDKINKNHPEKHRWIAVSRDLETMGFKYNDTIVVSGTWLYDGLWIIKDRMNSRYEKKIDFLVNRHMYMTNFKPPKHGVVTISKTTEYSVEK